MKQRARAQHLRFVEPSPPTRAVPHSSSPTVLLFSKKLSNIASTQINGVLLSNCDRHRQPILIVFESCFRFFGDTIIASHQAVRAKSHEATNKSTTPACLSSRPRRQELSPATRRRPFCCSRRSCPTPLPPSHRQHPGYSKAKSHEATSLEEAARHRFKPNAYQLRQQSSW